LTSSLDIGCGYEPKNPFSADRLFGIDQIPETEVTGRYEYKQHIFSNSVLPFETDYFNYVTAYDVLEHVPRTGYDGTTSSNEYLQLIAEIYRVLKPGGLFFARFPVYPHRDAFTDPTHVNIMTNKSHLYLIDRTEYLRRYGYEFNFTLLDARYLSRVCSKSAKRNIIFKMKDWYFRTLREGNSHYSWILKKN
jgi:SAM-dependent methyltransferase